MKKRILILWIIALLLAMPGLALANAAEPPGLTVIVNNPPDDLTLTMTFSSGDSAALVPEHRFWEGQYRFFYHTIPNSRNMKGAVITAEWEGQRAEFPIPDEYFGYDEQVTLDLESATLTQGQKPLRAPLLTAMRILLTLIIEGALLYAFGYRTRRSVKLFLLINIITQTLLNLVFIGADGYWQILFVIIEIGIFVVESLAYKDFMDEHGKKRAVLYGITANLASLLLGGWMISSLPV